MTSSWTPEEDTKLLLLRNKYNDAWDKIAMNLNGKTGTQVETRFLALDANSTGQEWSDQENTRLLEAVAGSGDDWTAISRLLGNRSARECYEQMQIVRLNLLHSHDGMNVESYDDQFSGSSNDRDGDKTKTSSESSKAGGSGSRRYFSRIPWSDEENEILRQAIDQYDHDFSRISKLLPNRTTSQVRTHWINALDDSIKTTPWTVEEDTLMFRAWRCFGNRWAEISAILDGRPPCAVRRRFNCKMIKIVAGRLERGGGSVDFHQARTLVDNAQYNDEDEQFHYSKRQQKNHRVYTDVLSAIPRENLTGDLVDPLDDIVTLVGTELAKRKLRIQKPKSGGVFDIINTTEPIAELSTSSFSSPMLDNTKLSSTPSNPGSRHGSGESTRKSSTESTIFQDSLAALNDNSSALQDLLINGNNTETLVQPAGILNMNSMASNAMLESMLRSQTGVSNANNGNFSQFNPMANAQGFNALNANMLQNLLKLQQQQQQQQQTSQNNDTNALLASMLSAGNMNNMNFPFANANNMLLGQFGNLNSMAMSQLGNLGQMSGLVNPLWMQQQQSQVVDQLAQQRLFLQQLQQMTQNQMAGMTKSTSSSASNSGTSTPVLPTAGTKRKRKNSMPEDGDGNESDDSFELAAKALSGLSEARPEKKKAKTED